MSFYLSLSPIFLCLCIVLVFLLLSSLFPLFLLYFYLIFLLFLCLAVFFSVSFYVYFFYLFLLHFLRIFIFSVYVSFLFLPFSLISFRCLSPSVCPLFLLYFSSLSPLILLYFSTPAHLFYSPSPLFIISFFSLYPFFLLSIFALLLHLSAIVLRLFLSLLFFSFLSNFPFPLLSSSIDVYFRIFPPSLLSLIFIFLSSTQFIVFSLPPERLQLFGEFVILAGFIYIQDHYFSLEYIFSLARSLHT